MKAESNSTPAWHSWLPVITFALAIVALGLSIALACKHEGICTGGSGCLIGDVDGCAELGKSPRSRLFGTGPHIAWLGVFYYAAVALISLGLWLRQRADANGKLPTGLLTLITAAVVFGFVFDLFLAYINFAELDVPCLYCLYTYICQLGMLIAVALLYGGARKQGDPAAGGLKDLMDGLAQVWWAPLGALIVLLLAYIALPSVFGDSHAGHGHAHGHSHGAEGGTIDKSLLPEGQRSQRLRELRAFNRADLSTAGLTSYEGEQNAYIIVHKWADFRCGHCKNAHDLLRVAQERWPGRIKVYYRHFPLDKVCNPLVGREAGGYSCNGAQAALCAPQKIFGEMNHGIFELQTARIPITPDQLRNLNESVGGNWSSMLNCMGSAATQSKLQRDIREAEQINVQSTPTLVLNGHILPPGTPRRDFFLGLMDALVIEKEGDAAIQDFQLRRGGSVPASGAQ